MEALKAGKCNVSCSSILLAVPRFLYLNYIDQNHRECLIISAYLRGQVTFQNITFEKLMNHSNMFVFAKVVACLDIVDSFLC